MFISKADFILKHSFVTDCFAYPASADVMNM